MRCPRIILLVPGALVAMSLGGCYERVVDAKGFGAGTATVYEGNRDGLLQAPGQGKRPEVTRPESLPPPMW